MPCRGGLLGYVSQLQLVTWSGMATYDTHYGHSVAISGCLDADVHDRLFAAATRPQGGHSAGLAACPKPAADLCFRRVRVLIQISVTQRRVQRAAECHR